MKTPKEIIQRRIRVLELLSETDDGTLDFVANYARLTEARLILAAIEISEISDQSTREVLRVEDFTEQDLEIIRKANPVPESSEFDHELKD